MKKGFVRRLKKRLALKLAILVRSAEEEAAELALPGFANSPQNLLIQQPARLINARYISIGDDVSLGPGCMLNAIRRYPGSFLAGAPDDIQPQEFEPSIRIGNRVSATGYLTIGAVSSVVIEDDVLLASHIFISDNRHGYSRTDIAYMYQPLEGIQPVIVGQGTWIGEHVVIMPGVKVGEYSIVGANSVVTKDVPARSMVVGSPARVIRKWSDEEANWIRVGDAVSS